MKSAQKADDAVAASGDRNFDLESAKRWLAIWGFVFVVSVAVLGAIGDLALDLPAQKDCIMQSMEGWPSLSLLRPIQVCTEVAQSLAEGTTCKAHLCWSRLYVWLDFAFMVAYAGFLHSLAHFAWGSAHAKVELPVYAKWVVGSLRALIVASLSAYLLFDFAENVILVVLVEAATPFEQIAPYLAVLSAAKFRFAASSIWLVAIALALSVVARWLAGRRQLAG
ncbi:MAG: hypothetical protein ACKVQU_05330 [Burkholderiales bacterium]